MIRTLMIAVATRRGDLGRQARLLADSDFAGKGDDKAWISAINAEL